MKKVLYISSPAFLDNDFILLKSLRGNDVVTLFMLYPDNLKATIMSIDKQYPKTGIFKAADIYPEFSKFSNYLDLENTYVLNRLNRKKCSFANIYSYLQLICFIISNNFSVIFTTIIFHFIDWPLYLFAHKTYSAFHDPIPHSGTNVQKNIKMYQKQINHVKGCIIYNQIFADEFKKMFKISNTKIFVSKLGVYSIYRDFYKASLCYEISYVLFWGRIESYKGVEYLLEAMTKVHEKYPDKKLIVAGRGEMYWDQNLYRNLEYIKFDNRFLSVEELASLIANCSYVVCPYKDATQSGVITTAYAFNKPVIATNVGALPEYVQDGKFGIIVPPCDSRALADAMIKIESDNLIDEYSNNIKEYYSTGEGSWKSIANNLITHLNK